MVRRMRTTARWILTAGLVVLALSGCGGGGGDDDDGVASIDSATTDEDSSDDGGGGGQGGGGMSQEFQDAMLEYAECMRDEGIDFPDPQMNGDGLVIMGGGGGREDGGPPSQAEMDAFEAADEACQHILEAVEGEMPRPDPEQEAEMRDQALAFSECMRENGVENFPDPQFDEDGGMTMSIGGPDGGGIDPEDPDFQDAQEACSEEGGPGFRIGSASPGDDAPELDTESNEDEG